jgi:large subunit ribosomal protein L15
MELNKMKPAPGSRKKRKTVGRGESSGHGKTCCRGGKGQKGRKGVSIRAGFEGGQMPLYRRLPKLGFRSYNKFTGKTVFVAVNLSDIEAIPAGTAVTPELLVQRGLGSSSDQFKLLGTGTVTKKVTIKIHAASPSAKQKIEAAGGSVEVIE